MNRHLEIIPEDGAIRALILALGFPKPNIGNGIGDTLNKIQDHFKNRFAIGIVDDDKRKPKLFDAYATLHKEQDFLQLKQRPDTKHFLVVLQPAVETWLLQNAESALIQAPFPTLKDLKRITKNEIEVVQNQRFRQFLNDLSQANAPGFVTMAKWIDELYDNNF